MMKPSSAPIAEASALSVVQTGDARFPTLANLVPAPSRAGPRGSFVITSVATAHFRSNSNRLRSQAAKRYVREPGANSPAHRASSVGVALLTVKTKGASVASTSPSGELCGGAMSKARHPITERALTFALCEERRRRQLQRDVREEAP